MDLKGQLSAMRNIFHITISVLMWCLFSYYWYVKMYWAVGADGVLVGTRFFATPEALGHDAARQRIVEAQGDATLRTTIFDLVRGLDWPEPYTGRAIANKFSARWHGNEVALRQEISAEQDAYAASSAAGDVDTAVVFAGECVDLIDSVEPAGDLVARIVADAKAILRARAAALTA